MDMLCLIKKIQLFYQSSDPKHPCSYPLKVTTLKMSFNIHLGGISHSNYYQSITIYYFDYPHDYLFRNNYFVFESKEMFYVYFHSLFN